MALTLGSVSGMLWHDMNETDLIPDTRIYLSWGTREGYGQIKDPDREDTSSWIYKTYRGTANRVIAAGGMAKLYCQMVGYFLMLLPCEDTLKKR